MSESLSVEEGSSAQKSSLHAVFAGQLALVYVLTHLVQHHFEGHALAALLPGSTIAIVVGACSQMVLTVSGMELHASGWDENLFMLVLLPPVILAAGWNMHRNLFYARWQPILALAIGGTFVSIVCTALMLSWVAPLLLPQRNVSFLELLAFGALISSTDPVSTLAIFERLRCDPHLHYIVLGESLLNDSVALSAFLTASESILRQFHASSSSLPEPPTPQSAIASQLGGMLYIFFMSILVGYLLGVATALLFRFLKFGKDKSIECIALLSAMVLLPFWVAETLGLSGIVAILFSGIASRRYVAKNIPAVAKKHTQAFLTLSANLAEHAIFLLLGLSVPPALASVSWGWAATALLACTISRALAVYPMLTLCNLLVRFSSRLTRGGLGLSTAHHHILAAGSTREPEPDAEQPPQSAPNDTPDDTQPAQDGLVSYSHMTMIAFSGIRGAVAFACANMFPDFNGNRALVVETTTFIVLATLVVQGSLTEWCIKALGIAIDVDPKAYLQQLKSSLQMSGATTTDAISDPLDSRRLIETAPDWEQRWIYPLVLAEGWAGWAGRAADSEPSAHITGAQEQPPRHSSQCSSPVRLSVDARRASTRRFEQGLDTSGGGGFRAETPAQGNVGSPLDRGSSVKVYTTGGESSSMLHSVYTSNDSSD